MKKFFILISILLLSYSILPAQGFQSFIVQVLSAPDSIQKKALVDSFMTANPKLPYIENDTTMTFVYRNASPTSVTVAGDANYWSTYSMPLTKLPGTDLWYQTKKYESDARLDYKFVLNGSSWVPDPKNPYIAPGGYGNSELRMPAYVPAPEIQYYASIPHGTIKDTSIYSVVLNNTRTVRVYLPPSYGSSTDSFPVIFVHDGIDYFNFARIHSVIDYLAANNRIIPTIAVLVPPVNREPEYAGNQIRHFSAFIVGELMPYIDSRYRTRKDPRYRAVLGASNGGNISLYLGGMYPEIFGNVAAQSSNIIDTISSQFQNNPRLDLKLYLDLGTYDIPQLIPLVRNFIPILQSKGYEYRYEEYHEGHSWGNWRAHIDDALEMFFPGPALSVPSPDELPGQFTLFQNYPNPFNPGTVIRYSLPVHGSVTLKVFDIMGREVATIIKKNQPPGMYSVQWDASMLPGGIYFYRLTAGTLMETRKMILIK